MQKVGVDLIAVSQSSERKGKGRIGYLVGKASPILSLLILVVYLAIANPRFFTVDNFLNIARQSAVMGILAIGQSLVIMTAGIDLSVGSTMALAGSVSAVTATQFNLNPVIAIILGILSGVAVGLINGLVIMKANVQDFIATLGSLTAIEGVALLVTGGLPISGMPNSMLVLGQNQVFGLPVALIVFLVVAAIGWTLLNHTTLGRNALAIGGNRSAAWTSGINVDLTKILIYGFSGLCAGIASVVMIGRLNSANALMGDGFELLSISAVVLGGTSLFGGAGSIGGTIIGVITIGTLNNGLDFLNVSEFWQKVILGVVIVAVVALDTWRRKRLGK